jgi:hypothetical protein
MLRLLDLQINNNAKIAVGSKTAIPALIEVGAIGISLPPYLIKTENIVDIAKTLKTNQIRSFILIY